MLYNISQTFQYDSAQPKEIIFRPGLYQIECQGAQGYNHNEQYVGGKGAYVKGTILLKRETNFFLYIGEYGKEPYFYQNSFNGGGIGQFGGGNATDIRYTDGNWSNFDSLKSRIIVAAGGGGPDSSLKGGVGGTFEGKKGENGHGDGGKQTIGGIGCSNGTFGKGGGEVSTGYSGNGGGGSGYYGGSSDQSCGDYGGGGGSSFISGHPGCDGIKSSSTEGRIVHTGQSYHYSGYFFKDTLMLSGDEYMPSPNGGTELGHSGNGTIRITILGGYVCSICARKSALPYLNLVYIFLLCHKS